MTWNKNGEGAEEQVEQLKAALVIQVEVTQELTRLKKELEAEKEKLQKQIHRIVDAIREHGL